MSGLFHQAGRKENAEIVLVRVILRFKKSDHCDFVW